MTTTNPTSSPRLRRRTLLAGTGLLGLAAGLGACSGERRPTPAEPATAPTPAPGTPAPTPEQPLGSPRTADALRPAYHFTPESGNLADPNGLVHHDGEYHLFHQADGSWAHATSTDRWHWTDQPVALEGRPGDLALSGSAVVDAEDASGLLGGAAGLVAVFTSTAGGEQQSIAASTDARTFTPYAGNPVVPGEGRTDFRDPKVVRHEPTGRWVMVVSLGDQLRLLGSTDLRSWEHLSDVGDGLGLHTAVWECPDLFPLALDGDPADERWVLHTSVGDSDATAGSTAQWFVGTFDGTTFTPEPGGEAGVVTDLGQDFYAAQSWSDDPGARTWIGWMSNWRYPYGAPTGAWRGAMSVPRELALETRGGRPHLVQRPQSTQALRTATHRLDDVVVGGSAGGVLDLEPRGTALEVVAELSWDAADPPSELGLRVRQGGASHVATGVRPADGAAGTAFLDRSASGTEPLPARDGGTAAFGRRTAALVDPTLVETGGPLRLHVLVDTCSVEVFLDDGALVGTNLVITDPDHDGVQLYAEGAALTAHVVEVHELATTWSPRAT